MAITVTGFTAEKMLELEAATVTGGYVNVAGHLILTTVDSTEIDCGSVIGPEGDVGPIGEVSTVQLNEAIQDAVGDLTADGATTSAMLADGSVTTDKIGLGATTSAKIATSAVIESKIANDAVTTDKIENDAVTTDKIANGTIKSLNLANGAVTSIKQSFIFIQPSAPTGVTGGIWIDT